MSANKLWALPLVIRAILKGSMFRRMAPFILDDERQSPDLITDDVPRNGFQATEDFKHAEGNQRTEVDCVEDISIALEWKLLLPLLAPGAKDPRPGDERPVLKARRQDDPRACLEQGHERVAQTIREVGEEAVTLDSLLRKGGEEKDYWASSWVVKKANSAEPLDDEKRLEGYIWVPVEICSPKMRFKDAQTRVRMQRVLETLNARHRLAANCTCEVHIHLGRMDGRPWSLSTLQRLGTLLWFGEPTLRSIRDPNSPNFDNIYTWGFAMRQRSRLAKKLEGQNHAPSGFGTIPDRQIDHAIQSLPSKDLNAVVEIWKAASRLELGHLLSGPEKMYRRLGFNFSAFGKEDERARRNPRTMEFRMMDGSVDTSLILGWLAICGTIAETAVGRLHSRFAAALGLLLQRPGGREALDECRETLGDRRGREFRELMQALGVQAEHYRGFEDKIRREHWINP